MSDEPLMSASSAPAAAETSRKDSTAHVLFKLALDERRQRAVRGIDRRLERVVVAPDDFIQNRFLRLPAAVDKWGHDRTGHGKFGATFLY